VSARYDAAVAGSGPAGCAAALGLARAGARVVILEKENLPRYKTCGGGIVARALALLPIDPAIVVERAFRRVEMSIPSADLRLRAERSAPIVSMTMRRELDNALLAQALEAGAELIPGHALEGALLERAAVTLRSGRLKLRARFAIAADGAASRLARVAGWPLHAALAPALEWEIWPGSGSGTELFSRARFEFDTPRDGYAWVFPKREHLSAGVLSTARHRSDGEPQKLQAALRGYLERTGLRSVRRIERHGYVIPLAPRAGPPARQRVFLTGDAAGLADPLTAEGISHAWMSGRLCAESLVESAFESPLAEDLYRKKLRRSLLPELRAGAQLARLLYGYPATRNAILQHAGARIVEAVTDVFTGERSYRSLLHDPRTYFKLLWS